MYTESVQSNSRPEELSYYGNRTGTAEVYIRENITETENEDGTGYEYDEIYFQTEESREDIEKNLEVWKEYGKGWEEEETLNQADIIRELQEKESQNRSDIEYIAAMTEIELEG